LIRNLDELPRKEVSRIALLSERICGHLICNGMMQLIYAVKQINNAPLLCIRHVRKEHLSRANS